MKKILFLFPYPHETAGSQRFRFEQYLDFLKQKDFSITLKSFLSQKTWNILYKDKYFLQKVIGILNGFWRRFILLFSVWKYNFVFIHREATPIGFPWVEWCIAKIFRKKIIFDFDDAIWLPNTSQQNKIVAKIKFHEKTALICRWAYKVSAGNAFLADYAKKYTSHVFINPTTIDTENWHNPALIAPKKNERPIIGWTGTHSTIQYLLFLVPIIEQLSQKFDFTFLVISDKKPDFMLDNLLYIPWNKTTEIEDLSKMDIGVMPLEDDLWAKGKCGFKALQYMAMGVVPVISPVGVNTEIVQDQQNGFLAQTEQEWLNALEILLTDATLRLDLGKKARKTIVEHYSVQANRANFLGFFA
ncbi:MAG: glycosyltransferase [Raineya sp.]|jgi:glycosyltransferase involved in cell wall biosynthesis|nr:glycosyltransferase [Raineya sp.]